jgi:hypothetical protein
MTAGCQTGNVGNALNSQTTPTRSQCPLELHFQQPAKPSGAISAFLVELLMAWLNFSVMTIWSAMTPAGGMLPTWRRDDGKFVR